MHTIRYGLLYLNRMKRLEKEDWFVTGLSILEADGFSKITIENLCNILKVTKGSFYHHFGNIDGYIEALMKYWLKENTLALIQRTEEITDIKRKQALINDLAIDHSKKSSQLIRAWSYSNRIVKEYLDKVDQLRLNYLINLKVQDNMDESEAKYLSMLEYAFLVGMQQLYSDLPKEEFETMYELFKSKVILLSTNESL